jgi:hypothetical protein
MKARFLVPFLVLFVVVAPAFAITPLTVVVPAGTSVHFKLRQTINTATAKVGDTVPAQLTSPIVVNGHTVATDGASATVRISEAEASGRIGGSARLRFSLVSIALASGTRARVHTSSYVREGKAHAKHNATIIAGGAIIGALAGQALGGNSRATEQGAAVGAGVGIGAAAATGKFDFEVKAGDRFALKLRSPVSMTS